MPEKAIRLEVVDGAGIAHLILLSGCIYFVANNFIEGNVIDRMYIWPVMNAPDGVRRRASQALNIRQEELERSSLNTHRLFVLESSYGADVYAIVEDAAEF